MAFIVEDGTEVANANSFVSAANARLYAVDRGVTLPSLDSELEAMLVKAADYLEAQATLYQGERTSETQELQFPRTGVYVNKVLIASDAIPKVLIAAQIQLAIAINAGLDLQPNIVAGDYVIKEKVGPIETVYANPLHTGIAPTFTAAMSLLKLLFRPNSTGLSFKTIRV